MSLTLLPPLRIIFLLLGCHFQLPCLFFLNLWGSLLQQGQLTSGHIIKEYSSPLTVHDGFLKAKSSVVPVGHEFLSAADFSRLGGSKECTRRGAPPHNPSSREAETVGIEGKDILGDIAGSKPVKATQQSIRATVAKQHSLGTQRWRFLRVRPGDSKIHANFGSR